MHTFNPYTYVNLLLIFIYSLPLKFHLQNYRSNKFWLTNCMTVQVFDLELILQKKVFKQQAKLPNDL